MQFHEKLHQMRKAAGMTQSDLAEKLDVSRQAVSRWEMGAAMPDVENLIAMSDLFGVSLDYMLKDKQDKNEDEPKEQQSDYMSRFRQMKPLEIAAMVVLILIAVILFLLLMDSAFSGVLLLILLPAIFVITVQMAQYL